MECRVFGNARWEDRPVRAVQPVALFRQPVSLVRSAIILVNDAVLGNIVHTGPNSHSVLQIGDMNKAADKELQFVDSRWANWIIVAYFNPECGSTMLPLPRRIVHLHFTNVRRLTSRSQAAQVAELFHRIGQIEEV